MDADEKEHESKLNLLPSTKKHSIQADTKVVVSNSPDYIDMNITNIETEKSVVGWKKLTSYYSQIRSIFTLCSISLGVGVFVLPKTLLTTGIATGVCMNLVFALIAGYTQCIAIDCAVYYNATKYEDLASASLGKVGEFLLALFMAITLLCANCSHIATVGELLTDIIEWFYTSQYGQYSFSWQVCAIYLY